MTIATTRALSVSPVLDARSDRLKALPPFLFDEIDRLKRERIAAGADVINLGVGDPDKNTPGFVVEAMDKAMRELANQQYPAVGGGLKSFREAVARFMSRRFGVTIDPFKHVVCTIGSKDGIAHLPWAVTNPGDVVLVPDPAYPVYRIGASLAGCRVHEMPVSEQSAWLPTFGDIAPETARDARICWANYPSNPTAAVAETPFYESLLEFTRSTWINGSRGCIAASDVAYSELYFDKPPVSIWQSPSADINSTPAIEFHSLSKTFNMTGWRIGFAVGHPAIIAALASVKANVDSGVFNAIQAAGAVALDHYDHADIAAMRTLYRQRRDAIVPGLIAAGCEVEAPKAGFFVWARTPLGPDGRPISSMTYAARLLQEADTVVVPGAGFSSLPGGGGGKDYIRIALTVEATRMHEAAQRLTNLS